MIGERACPFCGAHSNQECAHLALAVEGRNFVRRCVEMSQGHREWQAVCHARRDHMHRSGEWSPEREDFTWLETAFCEEFLKHLQWYGGMDYEWRTGPKPGQGGFWVLLWSKNSQRLWWELREDLERRTAQAPLVQEPPPWLIFLNPQ